MLRFAQSSGTGDHPRVCGEKLSRLVYALSSQGSPPRMRGKVQPLGERGSQAGITPACAGKREFRSSPRWCPRDHPRVCGEKKTVNPKTDKRVGSPPRMRGKACLTLIIRLLLGITPAHAGKSLPAVLKCPPTRDHPRVCGEKRRVRSWRALLLGSPPRMRGKGRSVY